MGRPASFANNSVQYTLGLLCKGLDPRKGCHTKMSLRNAVIGDLKKRVGKMNQVVWCLEQRGVVKGLRLSDAGTDKDKTINNKTVGKAEPKPSVLSFL